MIEVVVKEGGTILGEMRIEEVSPSVFSVQFAADSGGGWVDLKRRMLYGFEARKYNVLALVDAALSLLELKDMEMTDADHPAGMARGQRGSGEKIPRKAIDPVRDH